MAGQRWNNLLLFLVLVAVAHSSSAAAPNIVLIVADDLGFNAVGYHGGFVETPSIDRLAHEGVELDRFYVSPMCSPTRAGLLTGRYAMRMGMARSVVRPWAKFGVPPQEQTLAEALASAGYAQRGAFGKWHLGHLEPQYHPLAQGFTTFKGMYNGAGDYFTRDRDGQTDWHLDGDNIKEDGYTTDLIADAATAFITNQAGKQPFFCYVAFSAPHDPHQAPQKYLDRYKSLDAEKQKLAAMISCMDDGIGRILGAIEKAGIHRDTIVWFLSDNGGIGAIPQNNKPLRGAKLTVYEGGVRVVSAVRWPGTIEGGRKITVPIMNIDIMPTLLAFAARGVANVKPLDGQDVSQLLTGKQPSNAPRDLYFFNGQTGLENEQIAITSADGWKLIVQGPDVRREGGLDAASHKLELFNLADDPLEKTNLAADKPKLVATLGEKLIAFRNSEPQRSLAPINRKPPNFQPPANWHNPPPTGSTQK